MSVDEKYPAMDGTKGLPEHTKCDNKSTNLI